MKASDNCFSLIKRFEGLKLEAYLCPAGVWTIGWGHTAGVRPGQIITEEKARELLGADVAAVESDLEYMLSEPGSSGYPVTQGQWDALVSLCFNLAGGPRALPRKAPKLWAALMAHDAKAAAAEFLDMDHANGVELAGLKARRIAEAALFLS